MPLAGVEAFGRNRGLGRMLMPWAGLDALGRS